MKLTREERIEMVIRVAAAVRASKSALSQRRLGDDIDEAVRETELAIARSFRRAEAAARGVATAPAVADDTRHTPTEAPPIVQ